VEPPRPPKADDVAQGTTDTDAVAQFLVQTQNLIRTLSAPV
jgi:hypothetical protein